MEEQCRMDIILEGKDGVYTGGQTLRGVVKLELKKNVDMIGLEFKIHGRAFVKWVDHQAKGNSDGSCLVEHTAEEIYFDDIFLLWGDVGRSRSRLSLFERLEVGRHLFPFNVLLLPGIPCSYEGPCGWIRYNVTATLVTSCDATSVQTSRPISVLKELDLRLIQIHEINLEDTRDFNLQGSCCIGGNVRASLRLTKNKFVSGEKILVDTDIINSTTQRLKSTHLVLRQVVKYGSSSNRFHLVKSELVRIKGLGVKPGKRQCWCTKQIEVPAAPPSGLDGCKFIDIHYEIVFFIDAGTVTLSLLMPITIGSIPTSDMKFISSYYKAQEIHPNDRSPSSFLPDDNNEQRFMPLYRFYAMPCPRTRILKLHQSPHARKKQYLTIGDNSIQESTV